MPESRADSEQPVAGNNPETIPCGVNPLDDCKISEGGPDTRTLEDQVPALATEGESRARERLLSGLDRLQDQKGLAEPLLQEMRELRKALDEQSRTLEEIRNNSSFGKQLGWLLAELATGATIGGLVDWLKDHRSLSVPGPSYDLASPKPKPRAKPLTGISSERLAALNVLVINDPLKALSVLQKCDEMYRIDPNYWFNSGGFLIDIGDDLGEWTLLLAGILRIEAILDRVGDDNPTLLYNLANGYLNLRKLGRRCKGSDHHFDPDDTQLLRAKFYYRKALVQADQASRELLVQMWVNYGNCLSGLGRAVEAISVYGRAIQMDPNHSMAKGNLAVELRRFSRIAEHPVFLFDALDLLDQVLSADGLGEYAGVDARQAFERTRDSVAAEIAELGINRPPVGEDKPTLPSGYPGHYITFCAKHQLFLNFCLSCRRCAQYTKDSLAFSLITDLDDRTSFIRLARVVNEIKETYAFARLLLFQSLHPALDTVIVDELTAYVDNLDYAVYGTRVASLKVAFEGAYNALDRIAHFLNDYLALGVKAGLKLTFTTNGWIWHSKGTDRLRSELLDLENPHLLGLYDLARDLESNPKQPECDGYWGHLRRTRNSLTHEYLVPHVEGIGWTVEADKESLHLFYNDFVDQAVDLLQLVRAAVIYLIAFIDREERKKLQGAEGLVPPIYVTWYVPSLFVSALE